MATPIDRERTEALAAELMRLVVAHYRGEPSRDRVFEVMNALAFVVAATIAGVDEAPELVAFFERAVSQNVVQFLEGHGDTDVDTVV